MQKQQLAIQKEDSNYKEELVQKKQLKNELEDLHKSYQKFTKILEKNYQGKQGQFQQNTSKQNEISTNDFIDNRLILQKMKTHNDVNSNNNINFLESNDNIENNFNSKNSILDKTPNVKPFKDQTVYNDYNLKKTDSSKIQKNEKISPIKGSWEKRIRIRNQKINSSNNNQTKISASQETSTYFQNDKNQIKSYQTQRFENQNFRIYSIAKTKYEKLNNNTDSVKKLLQIQKTQNEFDDEQFQKKGSQNNRNSMSRTIYSSQLNSRSNQPSSQVKNLTPNHLKEDNQNNQSNISSRSNTFLIEDTLNQQNQQIQQKKNQGYEKYSKQKENAKYLCSQQNNNQPSAIQGIKLQQNCTNIENKQKSNIQNNSSPQSPILGKFQCSPEQRHLIFKKILAHFNFKVHNLETRNFMKIFGLQIKSISADKNNANQKKSLGNNSNIYTNNNNNINKLHYSKSVRKTFNNSNNNCTGIGIIKELKNAQTYNQKQQQKQLNDQQIKLLQQQQYQQKQIQQQVQINQHLQNKLNPRQSLNQQTGKTNLSSFVNQVNNDQVFNNGQYGKQLVKPFVQRLIPIKCLNKKNSEVQPYIEQQNWKTQINFYSQNDDNMFNENNNDFPIYLNKDQEEEEEQEQCLNGNQSIRYLIEEEQQIKDKEEEDQQQTQENINQQKNNNNQKINSNLKLQQSQQQQQKALKFPQKKQKIENPPFKFGNNMESIAKEEVFNKKLSQYRDFNFKINYGSYLFVQNLQQNATYKVYIGRGNNRPLLQRYFQQRWCWTIVDVEHKIEANFVWTQLKCNEFIKLLKPKPIQLNEIEAMKQSLDTQSTQQSDSDSSKQNRSQIIEKDGMQISNPESKEKQIVQRSSSFTVQNSSQSKFTNNNIQNSGNINVNQQQQQQPSQNNKKENNNNNNLEKNSPQKKKKESLMRPIQVEDPNMKIMNNEDLQSYKLYQKKYGKKEENLQLDDLSFRLQFLQKNLDKIQKIQDPTQTKSHNHLEFNWHLGNKKALFYNMRQYYELLGDNVFNYLPLTFHIQNGLEDKEYKNFQKYYKQREKEVQQNDQLMEDEEYIKKNKGKIRKLRNIWIVKPGEVTNRGNGITVCDSLADIRKNLTCKEKHSNGKEKTYIVQQYLDKPFLYNRRKFDIRCYMLITCINGIYRGYWYQEGYIRTSSYEFNLNDCSDPMIHLTNDAVQKYSEEYGKYEQGNKLSLQEFQRYLDLWHPDQKLNFFIDVYPKMKEIAADTIKATYLKLDPRRRMATFEIFGFDYMIDENFQPWLLEVNTNPDITTHTPITARVVPPMVENALRIGLDPIFPCPTQWSSQKKHLAPDNILENNKFELIFDESIEGQQIFQLYKDSINCLDGIDEMEEDEEIKSDEEEENNEKNVVGNIEEYE